MAAQEPGSLFVGFGYVNAWGVFQSYYTSNVMRDISPSSISWIGSIQYALVFLPGLIAGRLLDLGHFRFPFLFGSILVVVSCLITAECKKYWHFLLCQGILTGIGSGICFGPTLGIVGHWFLVKRGLALGMVAVGSSIGGTIYPIAARQLMPLIGFSWTMRVMALISMVMLSVSNLTLKPRLPPKDVPGGLFNVRVFRSPAFTIYCFATLVAFLGIYTVLTYINTSAVLVGVSPDFAFYLVSIANASSGPGRIATGIMADKFGPVNVMVPMTLASAIMTFGWPYAHTKGSLIVVAILYGFTSSSFVSALNMPVFALGEMGDVGRRLGTVMMFTAVGALCGPPISGAIFRSTGGFNAVSYYAGSVIVVATILMATTRYLILRRFWGKF